MPFVFDAEVEPFLVLVGELPHQHCLEDEPQPLLNLSPSGLLAELQIAPHQDQVDVSGQPVKVLVQTVDFLLVSKGLPSFLHLCEPHHQAHQVPVEEGDAEETGHLALD